MTFSRQRGGIREKELAVQIIQGDVEEGSRSRNWKERRGNRREGFQERRIDEGIARHHGSEASNATRPTERELRTQVDVKRSMDERRVSRAWPDAHHGPK